MIPINPGIARLARELALPHGFLSDLKKRLKVHNQGGNVSTKTGVPWTLAWYGGFESERAAIDFERYLIPDDEPDLDWFNRSRNPSNPAPDGIDQSQT